MSILTPILNLQYEGGSPLDLNSGLREFCYYENANGFATCYIDVHDHKMEEIMSIMTHSAGMNPVKFQHGHWTVGGGSPQMTGWKDILFHDIVFNMVNLGRVSAIFTGTCAGYKLFETVHKNKRAFVKMKISEIVKAIAARNNMGVDIKETTGDYTFYQANMTDGELISLMLNYAVGVDDRTDYKFYIRDGNTIVFKPPDYAKVDWHVNYSTTAATLMWGASEIPDPYSHMEPLNLKMGFHQKRMVTQNALFGEYRGFDPRLKQQVIEAVNDEKPTPPKGHDAAKDHVAVPFYPSNAIPVAAPSVELWTNDYVKNVGRATWSRNADNMFTAVLECAPLPAASPGQVIDITLNDVYGAKMIVSGLYYVYAASHNYVDSAFDSTKLYCQRRGYNIS